jgi:tetratricopeptide (TPR) repeat protein/tRNA A-37 threonylcarbamoyl transferase component Bud32
MARQSPATRVEVSRVGRYVVREKIGEGAFGFVFLADDPQLDRKIALKVAKLDSRKPLERIERLLREARAAAGLRHPNIVPVFDAGDDGKQYYIASAYINGPTLAKAVQAGPFEYRRTARLVSILAEALAYAHEQKVVHRDVKPANVLLDERDEPMLADFGLAERQGATETRETEAEARESSAERTRQLTGAGTPAYMAPEQATGAPVPASDQYSLGVLFYELLTGHRPFDGPTEVQLILHQAQQPPPLSSNIRRVPRNLEAICLKMLAKDPDKRYSNCRALAADLQNWLNGMPIQARPVPIWERAWLWVKRRPGAATLIASTALGACAFMVAMILYQSQRVSIYQRELQLATEREEVRKRSGETLRRAREFEAAGNWSGVVAELEKVQEALNARPDLRDDELAAEAGEGLTAARRNLEERQQARKRLLDFQAAHDDALFYHARFTGQDAEQDRKKTRAAARTALAIYKLDGEDPAKNDPHIQLQHDRPCQSAAEHARLADECYELLLIWAETEAGEGRGETDEQRRQHARRALSLLDRAARLGQAYGLETQTHRLQTDRFAAQAEGRQFDPVAALAGAPPATGRLDWFLTGLRLYRQDKFGEAIAAFEEVLRQQNDDFWAHYLKSLCQLRLGEWVEARAEQGICLNLRSDFAWPYLLRGFAASELGNRLVDLRQAAAEFGTAERDFDTALKRDPDPSVQYVGLANRGVLNIRRQRWAEAIRDLQAAVKVNPEGTEGYINLSRAFQGCAKFEEAVAALDQAIRLAPGMAELFLSRGRLHLLRKQRPAAQADFEKGIALDPKGARAFDCLVELGKIQHRDHSYVDALASFDRAVQLKPAATYVQEFRAEALLALGREVEAGRALDRYLEENRAAPAKVYQARGLIYASADNLPAALEMYTLALRQNPHDDLTLCSRGWAYLQNDAALLALNDFDTCLRDDPTSAEALAGRGNARIRLRQLEGALADARSAEKQGPLTDFLLYQLTRIWAQAVPQTEAKLRTAKPGEERPTVEQVAQCRQNAFDCLGRALGLMPPQKRAGFFRHQVDVDPALAAIRGGTSYFDLAAHYKGTKP